MANHIYLEVRLLMSAVIMFAVRHAHRVARFPVLFKHRTKVIALINLSTKLPFDAAERSDNE